jgi:hypothetical protein
MLLLAWGARGPEFKSRQPDHTSSKTYRPRISPGPWATPPSTKVRAADSTWGHTVKAIELEDTEGRLAALEQDASKLVPHTRKWLLYCGESHGDQEAA